MSKNSEGVINWRRKTKDRIIKSLGGKCCLCGYSKCARSLAVHHLDPTTKEFSFGSLRASAVRWEFIVKELRKCVLVCNNCHGEIHEGITYVPEEASRFNEEFADYKFIEAQDKKHPCPVCNELTLSWKKTCSMLCSGKLKGKINWEGANLSGAIQYKSNVTIAGELGCSEAAVRKRLKKLGLKRDTI